MSTRATRANSLGPPAPLHAQHQKTQVIFTCPYTARLSQDRTQGINPTHLIAASPTALLDTLLMLTKQKIVEEGLRLVRAEMGHSHPLTREQSLAIQTIGWEYEIAKSLLEDVSGGSERPFTIIKKRVADPFLEKLQDLRVLGGHDPKRESAAAIIEEMVGGKLRDVRFTREEIRAVRRRRGTEYPRIIVNEG
ncbi:MAG: hypothetical protein Q9167_006984 [Letrouitia subvulpina]